MTVSDASISLRLEVHPDTSFDAEDRERLVRALRTEIAEVDVDSITTPPAGSPPPGAKADPITIGALVVALSASGGVLTTLINTIGDWLERQDAKHRVSITIDGETVELARATSDERRRLIEAFVRRHGSG